MDIYIDENLRAVIFATTTPENTPFAYHSSTLANPNPTISPAFVEANYEVLESLLRERRTQIRNEDLRTELEYFSEDYDEEQRKRVVGFEEAPNREGSRRGSKRRLKQGSESSPTLGGSLGKERKRSNPTILFDLHTRRPPTFD
ncbi:hypothetical protein Tco_1075977 [Tanacetum coccineum]